MHTRKADFVGLNYYFRGRVTALPNSLTPLIPILDFLPATSYASPADPRSPRARPPAASSAPRSTRKGSGR